MMGRLPIIHHTLSSNIVCKYVGKSSQKLSSISFRKASVATNSILRPAVVSSLHSKLQNEAQRNEGYPVTTLARHSYHSSRKSWNTEKARTKDLGKENETPFAIQKLAEWIASGECKNILTLNGAGVSVAAGIPDFRTPGTGLYDNLQKYNLPYPEAVFDVDFYRNNPMPFCSLAKEIWPGLHHSPTLTHSFLALLAQKELLIRTYTQNIDGLEHLAHIPEELVVECHGHFRSASCVDCGFAADPTIVKEKIINREAPICDICGGHVKPDIVFFGEALPQHYFAKLEVDLQRADLLLILGTSLQVAPVSMIPNLVSRDCRRVLLNREMVGNLNLNDPTERDLFHSGDCDPSIQMLCRLLGWEDDLMKFNARTRVL